MKLNPSSHLITVACSALWLSSCQTQNPLAQPTDLQNAIYLAVDSIVNVAQQRAAEGKKKAGLYPETAQITFNVKATKTNTGKTGIDGGYGGVKLSVSNERVRSNEHGNTIVITLSSINKLDPTKPLPDTMLRKIGSPKPEELSPQAIDRMKKIVEEERAVRKASPQ